MERHELWEYFDAIELPDHKHDAVLNRVLHPEEGGNPVKHVLNITRLVAVAVAVCLITASVCFAASVFQWNEKFTELLKPTPSQMEALQGATGQPQASVTQNGVTITIQQTLADQHGIYILYDIVGPQNVTFTDDLKWEREWLTADTQWGTEWQDENGQIHDGGMSSAYPRVVSQEGNKRTVLLYCDSVGELQKNQKLTLKLENLGHYVVEGKTVKFHTVVAGQWVLTWDFTYENFTKTIPVNQTVVMPAGPNAPEHTTKVLRVEISPISVWVTMEGPMRMGGNHPIITYRDETQTPILHSSCSNYQFINENKQGGLWSFSYQFDQITDVSDIVSVSWGSLVVPIN